MKKYIFTLIVGISLILTFAGCRKEGDTTVKATGPASNADTTLYSEANQIILLTYTAVLNDVQSLYTGLLTLQSTPNSTNLSVCRGLWIQAKVDFDQSDAYQFGPAFNNGIDGSVNFFPTDTTAVDTILNGSSAFTQNYIGGSSTNVTGFHAIEFLLYGVGGNRSAGDLTTRQLSYMPALAWYIYEQVKQVDSLWVSASPTYQYDFVFAGRGSTKYTSQYAAFQDLIKEMAIMAETDETQKLITPFHNVTNNLNNYLESPYSDNTLDDVKNNIIGIQNAYLGVYGSTKTNGLSSLVSQDDAQLDSKMKNDITNVLNAISLITVKPFATALSTQTYQVQTLINMCDTLDKNMQSQLNSYIANTKLISK